MPLAHAYHDAYLAALVTDERETRAAAEVAQLGDFPADWLARLVVLRTYILTCLESQRMADDTFSVKLAAYRKDFDAALPAARAAQDAESPSAGMGSVFSIELQRG